MQIEPIQIKKETKIQTIRTLKQKSNSKGGASKNRNTNERNSKNMAKPKRKRR